MAQPPRKIAPTSVDSSYEKWWKSTMFNGLFFVRELGCFGSLTTIRNITNYSPCNTERLRHAQSEYWWSYRLQLFHIYDLLSSPISSHCHCRLSHCLKWLL